MSERKPQAKAGHRSQSGPPEIKDSLPAPLDEVDDSKTDQTDLPSRDHTGEPTEQVGGDRKMDRGRLTVPPAPAQPEVIHNRTRRNDHDALTGHAVEIVADEKHDVLGELKGRHGIFEKVDEYEKDGYPKRVIVSLNGVTGHLVALPYKAIRHLPLVKP